MWVSCLGQFFASTSEARLAQLVERKALNLVVVGSSPTVGACFPFSCVSPVSSLFSPKKEH